MWGGEIDWLYAARGAITYTTELWNPRNASKGADGPSREDEAAFLKYVLLSDGVVKWHEYQHPQFGKIELGGTKKTWGRTPPSFLLEEECHRNMAFTVYHASQMPQLKISEVKVDKLEDGLYRVWAAIENQRLIPTRLETDIKNHITPPDTVSIAGDDVKVLASGIVTDRFLGRVAATKHRPQRLELDSVPGMQAVRVQFILSGRGKFRLNVDSAHGGTLTSDQTLPP